MKRRIAVIFGGKSNEYEVSLRSAEGIIANLDSEKYDIIKIGITKQGSWLMTNASPLEIKEDMWQEDAVPAFISPDSEHQGLIVLEDNAWKLIGIDLVFPIIHGQTGEDGNLQGLLTLSGIPYVGCHTASSAVCFDKEFTHLVAEAANIKMAKFMCIKREELMEEGEEVLERQIACHIGYPLFIKPCNSGSSVGVNKASNKEELFLALSEAFAHDDKVLVEELISGFEVECAVLGNDKLFAPVVGQVISSDGFYDYDSKYVNSTAEIVIPANLTKKQSEEVISSAKKVFKALGAKGYARVDFFVTENGVIFNEINTIPGFTSISMFPKMMMAGGLSYSELLDKMIELARAEFNA